MTKLESLLKQYERAVDRLRDVLNREKNEFMRDSAIQRFEFTFELCWKAVKAYLEERYGVRCASPKSCFRDAFAQGVFDYSDFWLEMCNLRNLTAHIYDEREAEKIYACLPEALAHFEILLSALKKT